MKKLNYNILIVLLSGCCLCSCADLFIEKPAVTGMNINDVFSTAKNSEGAIAEVYGSILSSGLPVDPFGGPMVPYAGTEAVMGGEDVHNVTQGYMDEMVVAGMVANDACGGAGYTDDYFPNNYMFIRKAWQVYENIDMVSDMSDREKDVVKAEMQTLIAFRYLEMMKRYGGVPIVEKVLVPTDERTRSTVQETLDFIVDLCDKAAVVLDGHVWPMEWYGRVNKGVALAVKAEALMYAARPLFNSAKPYLQMKDAANNNLICLGNYDEDRWEAAIAANKEVIEWGKSNGFYLIDTDNPLADFGTAVGTLSNPEVLLAYKNQILDYDTSGMYRNMVVFKNNSTGQDLNKQTGISFSQLAQFRKADGTDQEWPEPGVERPASEYQNKAMELEPRALASVYFFGVLPQNNIGHSRWTFTNQRLRYENRDGCGRCIKFWYQAGNREWFEFPIYRMAEFYLNIAEAYNELGMSSESLEYLNIIRDRGGLEDETVTDKEILRKSIQREWAVEFYGENQWFPHARHWKMGDKMIAGPKYRVHFTSIASVARPLQPNQYVTYMFMPSYLKEYIWYDRMYLSPFTLSEVNKGYLVQNPGY